MNCNELVELVTDYLEGKLDAAEVTRFEQHILTCDGCTTYLDQMRRTINVVGELNEESLTSQQCDDLLIIFRDWKTDQ